MVGIGDVLGGVGGGSGSAIDPSGFHIEVGIVWPNGQKVPLWMNGGSGFDASGAFAQLGGEAASVVEGAVGGMRGGVGPVGPPGAIAGLDLAIVESAEIEVSLGLVATITIQIAAPYDLGIILLEEGLFAIGLIYEVRIGYPGVARFTPVFRAVAQKPSIKISGDEGLTVTLNGSGGGMAATRGSSPEVHENLSYREIIEQIAVRHGWDLKVGAIGKEKNVIVGAIPGIGNVFERRTESALDEKREKTSQENLDDWSFLQRMVRNAGCDAWLSPVRESNNGKPTLHIQLRKESMAATPSFRFMMRGNPDFQSSFPVLDLEAEAEFVWLPAAAVRVTSRDVNPDTGKTDESVATQESSGEPALGDAGVPSSAQKEVDGTKVQLVDADPEKPPSGGLGGAVGDVASAAGIGASGGGSGGRDRTGQYLPISARDPRDAGQLVQAQRDEGAMRGGIGVNITSYAIPEMMPGEVVRVDGAGPFNTNYYVMKVKHTANATEWTMRLEMLNNSASKGFFDQGLTKDTKNKNSKEVPGSTGNSMSGGSDLVGAVSDNLK